MTGQKQPILGSLYPSINYKIHSSFIDDPEDWVVEVSGEVFISDEDNEERVAAKCRLFLVDVESSGYAAGELLDTRQEIYPFISFYEPDTSSFNASFLSFVGDDVWHSNLLIIDRIEVLPMFRGRGLTKLIIDDAVNLFSARIDVVALKVFPLQFEYKGLNNKPNEWKKMMELKKMEHDIGIATTKLAASYESLGFVRVVNEDLMVKIIE